MTDRAILRAMHFLAENQRVVDMVAALRADDFARFLELIQQSGESSWELLQNCSVDDHQCVTLALALSAQVLRGRGAWRVHGGGFAGTIQAFVPFDLLPTYTQRLGAVFGAGAVTVLGVRPYGAIEL